MSCQHSWSCERNAFLSIVSSVSTTVNGVSVYGPDKIGSWLFLITFLAPNNSFASHFPQGPSTCEMQKRTTFLREGWMIPKILPPTGSDKNQNCYQHYCYRCQWRTGVTTNERNVNDSNQDIHNPDVHSTWSISLTWHSDTVQETNVKAHQRTAPSEV